METLRLIANSNKHETSGRPDNDLLRHLELDLKRTYAPLAESDAVREALAGTWAWRRTPTTAPSPRNS
jgi:hypothetical protein